MDFEKKLNTTTQTTQAHYLKIIEDLIPIETINILWWVHFSFELVWILG